MFVLVARSVRQLAELRAAVVVRLGAVRAEPDIQDMVSDARFGSTGVDDLLAELGITVVPPTDGSGHSAIDRMRRTTPLGAFHAAYKRGACARHYASHRTPSSH